MILWFLKFIHSADDSGDYTASAFIRAARAAGSVPTSAAEGMPAAENASLPSGNKKCYAGKCALCFSPIQIQGPDQLVTQDSSHSNENGSFRKENLGPHAFCGNCPADKSQIQNVINRVRNGEIDYKIAVDFVKRSVLEGNRASKPIDELMELVSLMIAAIDPLTFIFSLGLKTLDDSQNFFVFVNSHNSKILPEDTRMIFDGHVSIVRANPEDLYEKTLDLATVHDNVESINLCTLYSRSLHFPFADPIEEDLSSYFAFFECVRVHYSCWKDSAFPFLNAKIMSVLSHPEIPRKYAVGYLLPYIIESKREINPKVKYCVNRYLNSHLANGLERSELVFYNLVVSGWCPPDDAYEEFIIAYARSQDFSGKRFLAFIERGLELVDSFEPHMRKRSMKFFKKIIWKITMAAERIDFEYPDLLKINDMILSNSEALIYIQQIKIKFFVSNGKNRLPDLVSGKIDEFRRDDNHEDMKPLIFLCMHAGSILVGASLLHKIDTLAGPGDFRIRSLLEFVECGHISSIVFSSENVNQVEKAYPELMYSYLNAMVLYLVKTFLYQQERSLSLQILDMMLLYKKAMGSRKSMFTAASFKNPNVVSIFAFTVCYDAHVDLIFKKVSSTSQAKAYYVYLPTLARDCYDKVFEYLFTQLLNTKDEAYFLMLDFVMIHSYPLLLRNNARMVAGPEDVRSIILKFLQIGVDAKTFYRNYLDGCNNFRQILEHINLESKSEQERK